jgi:hypothetical protein
VLIIVQHHARKVKCFLASIHGILVFVAKVAPFPTSKLDLDAQTTLRVICAMYRLTRKRAMENAINLYAKRLGIDIVVNDSEESSGTERAMKEAV